MRRIIDHWHFGQPVYRGQSCGKCDAVRSNDAQLPPKKGTAGMDAAGRCVKCGDDAPKRFDGLCAGCFSRLLR